MVYIVGEVNTFWVNDLNLITSVWLILNSIQIYSRSLQRCSYHLWLPSHMSSTLRSFLFTHFTLSYYYFIWFVAFNHTLKQRLFTCPNLLSGTCPDFCIPGTQNSVWRLEVFSIVSLQLMPHLFLCSLYSLKWISCGPGLSAFFFVLFHFFLL